MSTIFDHYFAVLLFHSSKIPPWSFKDQQMSLCGNLGKCDGNPDSAHNNVKVPIDLYHTTIIKAHGDSMYSFTVLGFPKTTIVFDLIHTGGNQNLSKKKYRSNLTQNSFKVQTFVALVVELHKLLQYLSFCLFLVTLGKVKIILKELNWGIYVNEAMLRNYLHSHRLHFIPCFVFLENASSFEGWQAWNCSSLRMLCLSVWVRDLWELSGDREREEKKWWSNIVIDIKGTARQKKNRVSERP